MAYVGVRIEELRIDAHICQKFLFNAVLEEILKNLGWKGRGIQIKNRGLNLFQYTNLNNLGFADDVVLIGKNGDELSSMVEDLRRESEKMGLTINFSKTKIMSNLESLNAIKVGVKL